MWILAREGTANNVDNKSTIKRKNTKFYGRSRYLSPVTEFFYNKKGVSKNNFGSMDVSGLEEPLERNPNEIQRV